MSADELTPATAIPVTALTLLQAAPVEIVGRMPWASNGTFLVRLLDTETDGDADTAAAESGSSDAGEDVDPLDDPRPQAIYKPVRGERPLWDFEPGLHRREVAAYLLSETLGLGCVPPTIVRDDAPLGVGSLQWFVRADHRQHYFTLLEQRVDLHDQLKGIAVLDLVANNTDRKSGHCLLAGDRVWAIDNGLCFAAEDKLRTVIWEFAGESLTDGQLDALAALAECVPDDIASLLDDDEIEAMAQRAGALAEAGVLPTDPSGRRYPWPLV